MTDFAKVYFESKNWLDNTWRGITIWKSPLDIMLNQEIIWANRPECIIETGTAFGGSAAFFADMMELLWRDAPGSPPRVLSIDINARDSRPIDSRVTYLRGNSGEDSTAAKAKEWVNGRTTMISFDTGHTYMLTLLELQLLAPLVTPGQSLCVEDTFMCPQVYDATKRWFADHHEFTVDPMGTKYLASWATWFKRMP